MKKRSPQGLKVYTKTLDDFKGRRSNYNYYCWTYSAGSHDRKYCCTKAPGYKEEATKDNCMEVLMHFVPEGVSWA